MNELFQFPPLRFVYDKDKMPGAFNHAVARATYEAVKTANNTLLPGRSISFDGSIIGNVTLGRCIDETIKRQILPPNFDRQTTLGTETFFEVLSEYSDPSSADQTCSYVCLLQESLVFDSDVAERYGLKKNNFLNGVARFLSGAVISSGQILKSYDGRGNSAIFAAFRWVATHEIGHEMGLADHCRKACVMNTELKDCAPLFLVNHFCGDCLTELHRVRSDLVRAKIQ